MTKLLFSICNSLDIMPDSEDFERMTAQETLAFERAIYTLHSKLNQINQIREDLKHDKYAIRAEIKRLSVEAKCLIDEGDFWGAKDYIDQAQIEEAKLK